MAKPSHNRKFKILIIDSDTEHSKVLRFRLINLKNKSFSADLAFTLQEAFFRMSQERYDAILVDLLLPDSENLDIITKIQKFHEKIPLIVMTSLDDDELATEAVRKGAEDFVVKGDTSPKMLSRVILHAINRHQIKEKLNTVTKKLRHVNSQLEKYAVQDPLTEVYNRRGLQQVLTREIHTAERQEHDLVALVMDIDNFKKINDTLGHPSGDIVLKEIARHIKDSIRISDYVGRIGGDEFVLLLPDTDMDEAIHLSERLRVMISKINFTIAEQKRINVTVSMGIGKVSLNITSVDELIAHTDPLLIESKNRGKNCVFYENKDSSDFYLNPKTSQLTEIRKGKHFFALKQGIHALDNGDLVGYEFLSRMDNSHFEMPDDFFQVAIENDMITLVDHHCFNTCMNASVGLEQKLIHHINIFPSTLMDMPIDKLIYKLTSQSSHHYCIEISEQQILGSPSFLADPVQKLKSHGIQIAMDDVGFGHTCLENLIFLEPDILKIDKKCVQGISESENKQKAMKHLIRIAEELDCNMIAEGIETLDDMKCVRDLGIPYGQGYFLSMPQ